MDGWALPEMSDGKGVKKAKAWEMSGVEMRAGMGRAMGREWAGKGKAQGEGRKNGSCTQVLEMPMSPKLKPRNLRALKAEYERFKDTVAMEETKEDKLCPIRRSRRFVSETFDLQRRLLSLDELRNKGEEA